MHSPTLKCFQIYHSSSENKMLMGLLTKALLPTNCDSFHDSKTLEIHTRTRMILHVNCLWTSLHSSYNTQKLGPLCPRIHHISAHSPIVTPHKNSSLYNMKNPGLLY